MHFLGVRVWEEFKLVGEGLVGRLHIARRCLADTFEGGPPAARGGCCLQEVVMSWRKGASGARRPVDACMSPASPQGQN
jgi:hypothetical protein